MAMHKGLIGKSDGGGSVPSPLPAYIKQVQLEELFDLMWKQRPDHSVLPLSFYIKAKAAWLDTSRAGPA
jgi:hypothetical protein